MALKRTPKLPSGTEAIVLPQQLPILNSELNAKEQIPKSLFVDPWNLSTMFKYKEPQWQMRMSFDLLKAMSKDSVVSAIVNTRIAQMCSFAKPSRLTELTSDKSLGFKVIHKTKHPKSWTKLDIAKAAELEDFVNKCGVTPRLDEKTNMKRDGLVMFLKKTVRDSLIYDQACFEKVWSMTGKLLEFHAIDASTVRLASPNNAGVSHVQVIYGMPKVEFYPQELAFFVRNPRTDLKANGYGYSELEQMINTITSHLYAEGYNRRVFSQGTSVKGVLNLKGDVDEKTLEDFRSQWKAMTSGLASAWKTPVLKADGGVDFVNFGYNNREMEFSKWMEYLIKMACGIYQMDPSEINFDFKGGSAGQAPLFESSQEAKLKHSKDKGLRPFLSSMADMFNEEIMEDLDPEWQLEFVGIDLKSESQTIDFRTKEMGAYKTVDEVREEAGLEPLGEEKGGGILCNAQYIQWLLNKNQQPAQAGRPLAPLEGTEKTEVNLFE